MNTTQYNKEELARVVHSAIKTICEFNGDYSVLSWENCYESQRQNTYRGIEYAYSQYLLYGTVDPELIRENWLQMMYNDGWKYGDVKDSEAKTHPLLLSFNRLPINQKMKDAVFASLCETYFKYTGPQYAIFG